jgi:hypothetical protein
MLLSNGRNLTGVVEGSFIPFPTQQFINVSTIKYIGLEELEYYTKAI